MYDVYIAAVTVVISYVFVYMVCLVFVQCLLIYFHSIISIQAHMVYEYR